MKYKVTLKATLKRGEFYWVTHVDAASEDEAIVAAEHLFEAQMDAGDEWGFDDFNAEPG